VTVEVTNAQGRRIFVLSDDERAARLADADGDLNPGSMAMWNSLIRLEDQWDLVLDVGANYGEMLAGSTAVPGRRVVAFEPNPVVANLLRRTVSDLPFPVEVVESAVSSSAAAKVSFLSDTVWSGTSHLAAVEGGVVGDRYDVIEVPATTLDESFPDEVGSAFLKIDVEGAEMQVLLGAKRFLADTGRVAVMMEILHMPVQEVWDLRRDYQMALWSYEGEGLVPVDALSADELGLLLHSGEYYRQDAVFFAGRDAADLVTRVRGRLGTTGQRAERRLAELKAAEDERLAAWATAQGASTGHNTELDALTSSLRSSQQDVSTLRAERDQLSLELDVRAAELELLRSELARSASKLKEVSDDSRAMRARVADSEREVRVFKESRAYRWVTAYRTFVKRLGRR